ncbi:ABC transporter ATP-binding protein [Pyrococcus abyssi]|uniref:Iron (III) ABC transporter, atp-binding protein n=1 Tax=Pyrococcus abyssi (strain GE5 / Orsay) TaxID=272844 RepID=Q9UZ80_PYRAB|nr:ABC transporter ATP-binding protein [Pyrococcus abyssi]CAB50179.1 hemV-2 iron (III) ABC transporter, ATP-binding protein [Pyrococcus abyssi GE5]CCE70712.1 TPA: iron (III) ABC transporter, atp-binding protein [Pyrococcus abyssi GE5]
MPELYVNVSFSYGDFEVLKNAEFSARKGELVSIIGPNGSGKSTLLKCIAGILKPRGRISYDDVDLVNLRPKERAKIVSYVPQSSFPEFSFTVEEFVELGTYATGGDVEEALRMVGLERKRKELITRLSGGEYQLALIARALAQGSDVMLLDEPTSHLDINHTKEIMDLLTRLKDEKLIIAVLHDLNLALNYSDYIVIIKKGIVVWKGKTQELPLEVIEEVYGIKPRFLESNGVRVVLP